MKLFDFSYAFPNTIEEIDKMSGKDFEVFLFEYFNVVGCNPWITNDTDDKGVDLTIDNQNRKGDKIKVGIQAKRWKGSVGANELRKMLEGKEHYNLDELWIITTSKLTSSAMTTAKNNRIKVLNRDVVIGFLNELKTIDGLNFMPTKKAKVLESKQEIIDKNDMHVSSELETELKKLRQELGRELNISKLYLIYNNKTLLEICDKLPSTKVELLSIRGLGEKKVEQFGQRVIDLVERHKNSAKDQVPREVLNERINFLIGVRNRIAKYNSFDKVEDCFDNQVLNELALKLPVTMKALRELDIISDANIKLFGPYLIKRMKELVD